MARKSSTLDEVDGTKKAKSRAGRSMPSTKGTASPTLSAEEPRPAPRRVDNSPHPEVPPRRRPAKRPQQAPQGMKEPTLSEVVPPPAGLTQAQALQVVVQRASEGNQECLRGLRDILDANPSIWQTAGNVSALAERHWIEVLASGSKLAEESIPRHLKQLKAGLLGSDPTPLEVLLVDLIGVSWLAAQHGEIVASRQDGSAQQIASRLRRAESGHKRLLNASKTLAVIRALLPPRSGLSQRT